MTKSKRQLFNEFAKFHTENPHVYRLFETFTFQAIEREYEHFGPDAVIQRVRWETNIVTNDRDFKINNNHTAYYARLFMVKHPKYDGFFRVRHIDYNLNEWMKELLNEKNQLIMSF